jgi:hypothetical protein
MLLYPNVHPHLPNTKTITDAFAVSNTTKIAFAS